MGEVKKRFAVFRQNLRNVGEPHGQYSKMRNGLFQDYGNSPVCTSASPPDYDTVEKAYFNINKIDFELHSIKAFRLFPCSLI